MSIIALAIPAFFVLIFVEAVVAWLRHRHVYRFNDAVTDISCGIGNQIIGKVLLGTALGAVYIGVYTRFHLFELEALHPILLWAFGLLAYDLIYYWWHRMSHEVNVLWAAHIVHHHSEDYNLAVALRQAWFTPITSLPFYLTLALIGVPPHVYFLCGAIDTLYQFWIHTQLIDRVGPLEAVLNTPSHHRVHHGVNDEYLDRNYAGIFIFWDRLFGSFEPERAEPVYGTTKPLASFSPVWANLHHLRDIARRSREMTRWGDKLRVWFGHPGWHPGGVHRGLVGDELRERKQHKYDADRSGPWVKAYIVLHFIAVTYAVVMLLNYYKQLSVGVLLAASALVITTTAVWGGLFEGRRWAWPLEIVRLAGAAALLYYLFYVVGAERLTTLLAAS